MKKTKVDEDGNVKCPRCGAVNSLTVKRTGKAKAGAGLAGILLAPVTGGASLLAPAVMPKRLKCNGCGTNLKRG